MQRLLIVAIALWGMVTTIGAGAIQPLTNHPGNIFLAGEDVVIPLPAAEKGVWRLLDYESNIVAQVTSTNAVIALGKLPVGYYELRAQSNSAARVSLGVIAPLVVPTPKSSPIGLDVAMAQFHAAEQQRAVANLCALAGVSWVRDRFLWKELEPLQGKLAEHVAADDSVTAQADAGLQVLQVFCDTPKWAGENPKRFPADLQTVYGFMKSVATRWRGKVAAIEPWNEADTPNFGGHIGSEIASYQKACYLGLKAGNPDVIVSQNAFASPHPNVLADFNANEVWPYYDTFNIHHYVPPDEYGGVYSAFRPASAGKPLWVTEFNLPVHWSGDSKEQEPTVADLRVQAERVGQLFAATLQENPVVAFYFLLSHYSEGQVQFGLLHKDLTPRPGYIALAAVGRILADAKPLGRLNQGAVRACAFRCRPDGEERDVLVMWMTDGAVKIQPPVTPLAVLDHLGRAVTNADSVVRLTTAPIFVVCKKDSLSGLGLRPPPAPVMQKTGKACPVVLEVLGMREENMDLSAYAVSSERPLTILLRAYNFGKEKVAGELRATGPEGWKMLRGPMFAIEAGGATEDPRGTSSPNVLRIKAILREGVTTPADTVRIVADCGAAGEAVLSVRLSPKPYTILKAPATPLLNATNAAAWKMIAANGANAKRAESGVRFGVEFKGSERWMYPMLALGQAGVETNSVGLGLTLSATEGTGNFRVIFEEENGSAYFAPLYPQPKARETVEAMAMFESAQYGAGWSAPDDNGKLDLDKIRSVRIGCNADGAKLEYELKNVRWLKRSKSSK